MQNKGNKIKKFKTRRRLNIGQIIFIILFIYLFVMVISYVRRDKVRFYEVVTGGMVQDTGHRGLIFREESVQYAPSAGSVNYFVREARHVAVGSKIYSIDGTGSLTKFMKDNGLDGLHISDEDLRKIKNDLSAFSASYRDGAFSAVYDKKYLLHAAMLEYANLSSLESLEEKLKEENIAYTQVTSPATGLVSFIIDGMEDLQPDSVQQSSFDETKYSSAHIKAGSKVDAGMAVYKLITAEDWSLIFPLREEDLQLYGDKTKLQIRFTAENLEAKADYSTFTGSDGRQYGRLDFDKYLVHFTGERYIDFEIESGKASGLKIPKRAVFEKEFYRVPLAYAVKGGNSTDIGFNKEVYGESGTSIEFTTVGIYGLDAEYYYISMAEDSAIQAGDYLLSPSGERYQVGDKGSLSGVYNINKGYAVFKKIDVITSNDEYYTIEKGTKYGLNVYDHILINPENVNENDFVYQ